MAYSYLDLRTSIALYCPSIPLTITSPLLPSTATIHEYRLSLPLPQDLQEALADRSDWRTISLIHGFGQFTHPVLGLALLQGVREPGDLGDGKNLMDLLGGWSGERAQLLSTIKWDSETAQVRFYMEEMEFKRMVEVKGWGVVLFRSDSYQILSEPAKLEESLVVHTNH